MNLSPVRFLLPKKSLAETMNAFLLNLSNITPLVYMHSADLCFHPHRALSPPVFSLTVPVPGSRTTGGVVQWEPRHVSGEHSEAHSSPSPVLH